MTGDRKEGALSLSFLFLPSQITSVCWKGEGEYCRCLCFVKRRGRRKLEPDNVFKSDAINEKRRSLAPTVGLHGLACVFPVKVFFSSSFAGVIASFMVGIDTSVPVKSVYYNKYTLND